MAKPKVVLQRPNRNPDHYSKRDVPYWWAPEWIRGTSADQRDVTDSLKNGYVQQSEVQLDEQGTPMIPCGSYGKIAAVKETKKNGGGVNLYMKNKDGGATFIQGSIQKEFKQWHEDRSIDYILLGLDIDELIADEN